VAIRRLAIGGLIRGTTVAAAGGLARAVSAILSGAGRGGSKLTLGFVRGGSAAGRTVAGGATAVTSAELAPAAIGVARTQSMISRYGL